MLDVAWPELMVIGAVTLVAIGPKDMPKVMHTLGTWAAKAKRVTMELRQTYEQLNYEVSVAEDMENAKADLKAKETLSQKASDAERSTKI